MLLELRADIELQEYFTGGRKLLWCLIMETEAEGVCQKYQQGSGYSNWLKPGSILLGTFEKGTIGVREKRTNKSVHIQSQPATDYADG